MFDLAQVQKAIQEFGFDGWLLCDFRGSNVLAQRVCGIAPDRAGSRRWFYFVPKSGQPQKLVHRIESGMLDHLPGDKNIYLPWQQLQASIAQLVRGCKKVAMEYSANNLNPYVAKVDAGTVELVRSFGVEVASSGDLVQYFESRWADEQWAMHVEADRLNQLAYDKTWKFIRDSIRAGKTIRETDVQNLIMQHFEENGQTTYHPPIVGVNENAGDPHYEPVAGKDKEIRENDLVLVDLWSKLKKPNSVYSDITKMGFVGTSVPEKYQKVFHIVAAARDAGIATVKNAYAANRPLQGWEVDEATRAVIVKAGYGEYFCHRTGHNIGQETHGNGAHMDNLETKEERLVLPRTCFSIEPGIYLPEFGMRSEVDVYIDGNKQVHVTGDPQKDILPIMSY